jgi:hypothetical protein
VYVKVVVTGVVVRIGSLGSVSATTIGSLKLTAG